jgi:O-antigen/teichoic acid export membrane protein
VLATPLVVVLFGAKWEAAGAVMSAIALMYAMNAVIFPLGDVFKALGRQPTMVAYNAALVPAMVAAMVIASPSGIGAVVWARVGVSALSGVVLVALVLRALDVRLGTFLVQLRGAVAAGAGVVAGSGAVRLLWPDNSVGPLVTGTVAGAVLGLLALRLFGRNEYGELTEIIRRRLLSRAPLTSRPPPVTATVPTTEPPHERLAP